MAKMKTAMMNSLSFRVYMAIHSWYMRALEAGTHEACDVYLDGDRIRTTLVGLDPGQVPGELIIENTTATDYIDDDPETYTPEEFATACIIAHGPCVESEAALSFFVGSDGPEEEGTGQPKHSATTGTLPLPRLVEITGCVTQLLEDYQQTIEPEGCEIRLFTAKAAAELREDIAAIVIRHRSARPLPRYLVVIPAPRSPRSLWFESLVNTSLKRAEDLRDVPEHWLRFQGREVEVLVVSREQAERAYEELLEYLRQDRIEVQRRKTIDRILDALDIA